MDSFDLKERTVATSCEHDKEYFFSRKGRTQLPE
jgi:hypothetical protein